MWHQLFYFFEILVCTINHLIIKRRKIISKPMKNFHISNKNTFDFFENFILDIIGNLGIERRRENVHVLLFFLFHISILIFFLNNHGLLFLVIMCKIFFYVGYNSLSLSLILFLSCGHRYIKI